MLTGTGARTECTVSASNLGLATEVGQAGRGGSHEATLDDARVLGDGVTDSGGDGEGQCAGVVRQEVARRRARAAVARAVRMALQFSLRREPPKKRRSGFVERPSHFGDENPHLTPVIERVLVLPVVRCDV